mmetsp:Transcript_22042/g.74915  ORF Transcript_22042/g.74915 Transcript_22042/m.74915 type:complete len:212 (-) Transcript_22042:849-1484(-)
MPRSNTSRPGVSRPLGPMLPSSPLMTRCTSASVPAPFSFAVCTVTLYLCTTASLSETLVNSLVVRPSPLLLSSHSLHRNLERSPRPTSSTSTEARCHPAPNHLLSWPICRRSMAPTSGASRWNTSVCPRSKRFFEPLLSFRGPDDAPDPSSRRPCSTSVTFASVPAPFTSLVTTVTVYWLFWEGSGGACGSSLTCGFPSGPGVVTQLLCAK